MAVKVSKVNSNHVILFEDVCNPSRAFLLSVSSPCLQQFNCTRCKPFVFCSHYFLQAQQDEIMTHHHKMRASEVPPYAQATILAGLLEQYDNLVRPFMHSKALFGLSSLPC